MTQATGRRRPICTFSTWSSSSAHSASEQLLPLLLQLVGAWGDNHAKNNIAGRIVPF